MVMRVMNWITKSAPVLKKGSTIEDALKVMNTYGFSEIIITDDDGHFSGIVSKKDIFNKPKDKIVEECIVLPEFYVHPQDSIETALLAFMEHHGDFVPVVDEDLKVVGMITLQDILESMMEITAMDEPGTKVMVNLPDVPGALKRIIDALAENRMNILSLLTYRREDGKRSIVIKVDIKDAEAVAGILRDYGIEYEEVIEEEGF
jgi:acetoin utilization protein AcuB